MRVLATLLGDKAGRPDRGTESATRARAQMEPDQPLYTNPFSDRETATCTAPELLVSGKRELRSNTLLVVVSIFGYGAFFG